MVRELLGKLMVRKRIGGVRLKMIVKSKSVCVDICIYVYPCVSICESKHTPLDAAVGVPFGIYLLYGNDDLAHYYRGWLGMMALSSPSKRRTIRL